MELSEKIKDLQSFEIRHKRKIWKLFMTKYSCDVIAEIGVSHGCNFQLMIRHYPKLAIAVDSWINDGIISRNDQNNSQENLDNQYENFKKAMADKPFVKIYHGYSFDVVKEFEDEFFDLVYIDADHTYEGCLRDIRDWYPKVKQGKFLLGDDYREMTRPTGVKFGVIEAVNTFVKENNLEFYKVPEYGWGIIKPEL